MTFQLNPVAVRESRAMWRGARSFLLLLCYAGALSLVAFLAYSSEVRYAAEWSDANGSEMQVQSARVGHNLFLWLSMMQLLAWLLISPALSATSISSERERGLLESLLMSNLKPRQIIAGKLSVCASFVAILIVATLPVLAICFLLGGVSPGEFGGALALQLATAFCALSLGVWCSASLRLSTHALGATFAALVGWMLLTFFGGSVISSDYWMLKDSDTIGFLCTFNPFVGLIMLVDNNNNDSFHAFGIPHGWMWALSVAAQVLAGGLFLRLAARALSRPAEAEEEAPRRRRKTSNTSASTWGGETAGEPVALEDLESEGMSARESSRSDSADDGHFEVPLLSRIVGGGPLMRHHLRASWRWKKPRGRALRWWRGGALAFGLANLIAVCFACSYDYGAGGLLGTIFFSAAIAIPVFVTASSGLSIARDRELGMWDGLRLSGIRSAEIARAKMLTPLVAGVGYATLALAPLALLCWQVARDQDHWSNSDVPWSPELKILCGLALALPFWLLGTLQLSGWALICSTRARRSSIALVAAFAGGLIFLVGLPGVFSLVMSQDYQNYEAQQEMIRWLGLFHPLAAMKTVDDVMRQLNHLSYLSHGDPYGYAESHGVPWPAYLAILASHSAITYAFYRAVTSSIAAREK